jgi:hypothetical protein
MFRLLSYDESWTFTFCCENWIWTMIVCDCVVRSKTVK